MDFFKNGFCNRRGPHNQGCLFRHDEIEGQGKIEGAKTETGAEVLVFKAEAMGWNGQRAVEKQGYSDMAQVTLPPALTSTLPPTLTLNLPYPLPLPLPLPSTLPLPLPTIHNVPRSWR